EHGFKGLETRLRLFQAEAPASPRLPAAQNPRWAACHSEQPPCPAHIFHRPPAEIATVQALLTQARLVTLTGVEGTGKTRLATQVVSVGLDGYPDGVWFVDLSPLTDPGLIASLFVERARLARP